MNRSVLSTKLQATVPKNIRSLLDLKTGDTICFTICEDGCIIIRKAKPLDKAYYKALWQSLEEWHSEEDEEAYANL